MKIYVVDTNIVFSTAMNTNSRIGQFLMQTDPEKVEFYAPTISDFEQLAWNTLFGHFD